MPHQIAEAEDVNLFDLLEQWDPTDSVSGPSLRTPFGLAAIDSSDVVTPGLVSPQGRDGASLAPVRSSDLPPLPPDREIPMPPFRQHFDHILGEARHSMPAHGPYLERGHVGGSPVPQADSSAIISAQQQAISPQPQEGLPSPSDAEGTTSYQFVLPQACSEHSTVCVPDRTGQYTLLGQAALRSLDPSVKKTPAQHIRILHRKLMGRHVCVAALCSSPEVHSSIGAHAGAHCFRHQEDPCLSHDFILERQEEQHNYSQQHLYHRKLPVHITIPGRRRQHSRHEQPRAQAPIWSGAQV